MIRGKVIKIAVRLCRKRLGGPIFLLVLTDIGYDMSQRFKKKHVLKSYGILCDVHDSRKLVVRLIYTKQFVS